MKNQKNGGNEGKKDAFNPLKDTASPKLFYGAYMPLSRR